MVNKQYNIKKRNDVEQLNSVDELTVTDDGVHQSNFSVTLLTSHPPPSAFGVISPPTSPPKHNRPTQQMPSREQSTYESNIMTAAAAENLDAATNNCDRLNEKDMRTSGGNIKDIGRFQYILQMDREMVSFNF